MPAPTPSPSPVPRPVPVPPSDARALAGTLVANLLGHADALVAVRDRGDRRHESPGRERILNDGSRGRDWGWSRASNFNLPSAIGVLFGEASGAGRGLRKADAVSAARGGRGFRRPPPPPPPPGPGRARNTRRGSVRSTGAVSGAPEVSHRMVTTNAPCDEGGRQRWKDAGGARRTMSGRP